MNPPAERSRCSGGRGRSAPPHAGRYAPTPWAVDLPGFHARLQHRTVLPPRPGAALFGRSCVRGAGGVPPRGVRETGRLLRWKNWCDEMEAYLESTRVAAGRFHRRRGRDWNRIAWRFRWEVDSLSSELVFSNLKVALAILERVWWPRPKPGASLHPLPVQ